MKKTIYFCGDIHGDLKELVWTIVEQHKLQDSSIIIVGDFGVGFGGPNSMQVLYDSVKDRLEKNNIKLYTCRGNHDDPQWFDGKHNFPNLEFLEDHKTIEIDGWSIYPIGGATSIDIKMRIEENEKLKRQGSLKKVWWENERPVQKLNDLPGGVDIIISHTAPITFEPVAIKDDMMDTETYNKCIEDRTYLSKILNEIRAKYWFYGHFHDHYSGSFGNLMYRGLGIKELFELRCLEDF